MAKSPLLTYKMPRCRCPECGRRLKAVKPVFSVLDADHTFHASPEPLWWAAECKEHGEFKVFA